MIYLVLTFIFLFFLFFVAYTVIGTFISTYYAKQNFYGIINTDKNILLLYLINISNIFVPILKSIKLKIFKDYVNKLDSMLKVFDFGNNKINSYNFIFIQIVSMFLGCIISVFLFGLDLLFMICFGGLFLILPYLKIYEQYNKIVNEIIKQIPDVANLLSVMVYSGIDFNSSINKIVTILNGCLIKELKDIIKKVSLGIDIKQAFNELSDKYNIVQLNTFIKTILMTLDTGTGFADNLSKIAQQISGDNVAIAEKKAHEAPVKMLLPMAILILPTIFILLFVPFVISFFKSGSLF